MREVRFLARIALSTVLIFASVATAQQAAQPSHGIELSRIDRSVKPGDNFYLFANGEWIKRTEIPADRGTVGVFNSLDDVASKHTADIIEELSKSSAAPGSAEHKIADLYNSYMDEKTIEAKGRAPLEPLLKEIAGIKDKHELAAALGNTLRADVDPLNNTNFHTPNLFGIWVAPGFHDSGRYNAYLMQGGIALPDREYYLSGSEPMAALRTMYVAHVAKMLKLAGLDDVDARAKRVYDLEHSIAESHTSLPDNQDIIKADNIWKQKDFATKAPGLEWNEYFRAAGLAKQQSFYVWQPAAFVAESALVASVPLDTWKDWLAYHLIEEHADVLPKAFAEERFAFFGQTLSGTPQQRPRWQSGVRVVNDTLGDAVGQIYAKRYFSPEAKARAQAMVANIIEAFRKRIDALQWMDPATKAEAKAKLGSLYVGIGYPEKWRDYSKLEIKPDDIFGNLRRADLFDYHFSIDRLGEPVDKHEWSMTPQTVNAVNLPLQNALNFPAAILQPPFFDAEAPAAANYGAIGSVIGHEISHTFDTEGSTFDSTGALRNWWTPQDLDHFKAATKKLAQQYNAYHPFPDLAVNGEQTLPENIADLGGISAAYDGYRASLDGEKAPEQGGFNGDQQFFIAFAQNWAAKFREATLRRQVLTNEHAPDEYRADTVRNVDAWYSAFGVTAGEKLYLPSSERVRIW
jgi:endothelin-converting enzyme/putative endopeptidase